jgi:K+-sensing histidine kinase KdpD
MMPEISMNVLDVAQNSVRANASLIQLSVAADEEADTLTIVIEDDGCGMSEEQITHVEDPFFTTRTTRKVGLGVPFFKLAAQASGGDFSIHSELGKGTVVKAVFGLRHIDRMPLGDINGVVHTLITFNTHIDFLYTYKFNDKSFTLDTREFREILGGVPLDTPEVSHYIEEYLNENKLETDGGVAI